MPGQNTSKRLFVYGSLMKGFFNYDKVLAGKILSCVPARIRGCLFHQSRKGYPALIPGEDWVWGEFLELDDFDDVLRACDTIENFFGEGNTANEYDRRLSPVVPDNTQGEAYAYVYWYARNDLNTPQNPVEAIPSGDWRKYMEEISGSPSIDY